MQIEKRFSAAAFFLAATMVVLAACSGSTGPSGADGANGVNGTNGATGATGANGADGINGTNGTNGAAGLDLTATAKPESCAICHGGADVGHQSAYNQYTDATKLFARVDSVVTTAAGNTLTSVLTVTITGADGLALTDKTLLKQKSFYATQYDSAAKTFTTSTNFSWNWKDTAAATATPGQYTLTNAAAKFAPEIPANNGFVYGYVAMGNPVVTPKGHYNLYPDVYNFSWIPPTVTIGYTSTANVSACESCHGKPYRKHGYRMAVVPGLNDFVGCKACHTDQKVGTDYYPFSVRVDDPTTWAAWFNNGGQDIGNVNPPVPALPKYDYTATVMNDTHMSHAMEFEYPQSMSNCATCHEGHLDVITADANFKPATCKSCHPVTANTTTQSGRAPALKTITTATAAANTIHSSMDFYTAGAAACSGCHRSGGSGPTFGAIHAGYNSMIYKGGVKYSAKITASIDSVVAAGNVLDIKFSVTEAAGFGVPLTNMMPTVVISLYGYDTKDFIVSGHNRDDLVNRNLECVVGGTAACGRIAVVSSVTAGESASFEVTADLSSWASLIKDGTVKRAEIAVLPTVKVGTTIIALDAPSRTFDLVGNDFTTSAPIVDVTKCNKCHDALATSFHSADRGGSVTVCRVCHTTLNGGSHLEMQSRSIDSYAHAIHSFQAFDISSVNFADPVASANYGLKIESTYPNFTLLNCESCHVAGAYGVPDQSKSLPGVLSKSATLNGWDRAIGTVPSYVTGPGSRACGACHRASMINEDDAAKLVAFDGHTDVNGYMLDNSAADPAAGTFQSRVLGPAIKAVMAFFK